jgi:hypothetical protein
MFSTDTHLEIVVSKEGKTIRNISITTEISIHLTHQSMDPLQKKISGASAIIIPLPF